MSYIGRVTNKSSDIRVFDVTSSTSATHTLTWTAPNEQSLIVTINGIKQHEDAYSVSGTTLTLTDALVATDKLEVIGINDLGTTLTPAQNSITNDMVSSTAAIAQSKLATLAITDSEVADNALSGNKIDGGTISDFASTGIDDNADAVAITIDSSENVGIGETTPLGKVHIQSASSGTIAPSGNADELVIEGSGHAGISLYSGTTSTGLINFGDDGHDSPGQIIYDHNDNSFQFVTNTGERFRFASSGQLGVAGANYGTSGQVLTSSGASSAPSWAAAAGGVNTPAFGAYENGTAQSIANTTTTLMQFATVAFDTDSCFDNTATNYKFTPDVAGKYFFYAKMTYGDSFGTNQDKVGSLEIRKNGTGITWQQTMSVYPCNQCSGIVEMNGSSDYVQCYTWQNYGSNRALYSIAMGQVFYGFRIIE